MGNRHCAVLCYDADHSKSVNDYNTVVSKSSELWAKQLSVDYEDGDDDDDEAHHHNSYHSLGKRARNVHAASYLRRIPDLDRIALQTAGAPPPPSPPPRAESALVDLPPHPGSHYYSGFPADCRSMSSDTAGREGRSELDMSRRSSNTCERDENQDDASANRSL